MCAYAVMGDGRMYGRVGPKTMVLADFLDQP